MDNRLETVKEYPDRVGAAVDRASAAVDPTGAPEDVAKDLAAFQAYLAGVHRKARNATASLLEKPRVVAYLSGTQLPVKEEDLRKRLLSLELKLAAVEPCVLAESPTE